MTGPPLEIRQAQAAKNLQYRALLQADIDERNRLKQSQQAARDAEKQRELEAIVAAEQRAGLPPRRRLVEQQKGLLESSDMTMPTLLLLLVLVLVLLLSTTVHAQTGVRGSRPRRDSSSTSSISSSSSIRARRHSSSNSSRSSSSGTMVMSLALKSVTTDSHVSAAVVRHLREVSEGLNTMAMHSSSSSSNSNSNALHAAVMLCLESSLMK
jgi:hypothetical protein